MPEQRRKGDDDKSGDRNEPTCRKAVPKLTYAEMRTVRWNRTHSFTFSPLGLYQ